MAAFPRPVPHTPYGHTLRNNVDAFNIRNPLPLAAQINLRGRERRIILIMIGDVSVPVRPVIPAYSTTATRPLGCQTPHPGHLTPCCRASHNRMDDPEFQLGPTRLGEWYKYMIWYLSSITVTYLSACSIRWPRFLVPFRIHRTVIWCRIMSVPLTSGTLSLSQVLM